MKPANKAINFYVKNRMSGKWCDQNILGWY